MSEQKQISEVENICERINQIESILSGKTLSTLSEDEIKNVRVYIGEMKSMLPALTSKIYTYRMLKVVNNKLVPSNDVLKGWESIAMKAKRIIDEYGADVERFIISLGEDTERD